MIMPRLFLLPWCTLWLREGIWHLSRGVGYLRRKLSLHIVFWFLLPLILAVALHGVEHVLAKGHFFPPAASQENVGSKNKENSEEVADSSPPQPGFNHMVQATVNVAGLRESLGGTGGGDLAAPPPQRAPESALTPLLPWVDAVAVLTLTLAALYAVYNRPKKLVILPFEDRTTPATLEKCDPKASEKERGGSSLQGAILAATFASQFTLITQLYRVIDEMISPDGKLPEAQLVVFEAPPDLDIQDLAQQSVELLKIRIPLSLLKPLKQLAAGKSLAATLHGQQGHYVLIASLRGSGSSMFWEVRSEDLEADRSCDPWLARHGRKENDSVKAGTGDEWGEIDQMLQQLAYRVITDLYPLGSAKWRAVRAYTEALRFYRATLTERRNSTRRLRQAESGFLEALAHDQEFARCYHNLAIVYRDLEAQTASGVSFLEALKRDPRNFDAAYGLALLNIEDKKWKLAISGSERLRENWPLSAAAWNLEAYSQYFDGENCLPLKNQSEEEKDCRTREQQRLWSRLRPSWEIAAALAWRALAAGALRSQENIEKKRLAVMCTRNAGQASVITGKKFRGDGCNRQSLRLDPSPETRYEMVWSLYMGGRCKEALAELKRIPAELLSAEDEAKCRLLLVAGYGDEQSDEHFDEFFVAVKDYEPRDPRWSEIENELNRLEAHPAGRKPGCNAVARLRKEIENFRGPLTNGRQRELNSNVPNNLTWRREYHSQCEDIRQRFPWYALINCKEISDAIRRLQGLIPYEIARNDELNLHLSLAELSCRSHEIGCADSGLINAFDRIHYIVNKDPFNPAARRILGAIYREFGDLDQAEHELTLSLQCEPSVSAIVELAKVSWRRAICSGAAAARNTSLARGIQICEEALIHIEGSDSPGSSNTAKEHAHLHALLGCFHRRHESENNTATAEYHETIARNLSGNGDLPAQCQRFLSGEGVLPKAGTTPGR